MRSRSSTVNMAGTSPLFRKLLMSSRKDSCTISESVSRRTIRCCSTPAAKWIACPALHVRAYLQAYLE